VRRQHNRKERRGKRKEGKRGRGETHERKGKGEELAKLLEVDERGEGKVLNDKVNGDGGKSHHLGIEALHIDDPSKDGRCKDG